MFEHGNHLDAVVAESQLFLFSETSPIIVKFTYNLVQIPYLSI